MRILVVTTRATFPPKLAQQVDRRLNLGPGHHLELLTVRPPEGRLGFEAVHTVDPSVLPWRPVVPVAGPATLHWGGVRKQVVRGLRLGRRLTARLPRPVRSSSQAMLATACRGSRSLRELAGTFDVVVSTDPDAALGVWELARRVPGVTAAHRLTHVRQVLAAAGVEVPPASGDTAGRRAQRAATVMDPTTLPAEPARLLIAPANYAGQARAWAAAVRDHVPGATAMNLRAGDLKNPFPSDSTVSRRTYDGDLEWRLRWRRDVRATFTHVVVEANQPVLGGSAGTAADNILELQRAGKEVALLSHGSDARIPSVHVAREPWHQYDGLPPRTVDELEHRARLNVDVYNSFDGPVFVSTLGLIEFIPAAQWLPNVVDIDTWHRDEEPMSRAVPIVAHVPSGPQKGSHLIDPVLERLQAEGVIEYRRVEGLRFDQMPEVYGTADLVVEQFGIADYSAAACEAMAAGRVVVSRVADNVRRRALEQTELELPIEEANPQTLERVIRELVDDRDRARDLAKRGREYARAVHDGRRSAAVLGAWLTGAGA